MSESKQLPVNQQPSRSYFSDSIIRIRKHRGAMLGLWLLIGLVLLAIFAPFLTPHSPDATDLMATLIPPNREHWFGTDDFGRDILTRILFGGRISLTVGLIALAIGAIIGTLMGLVAGYFGGWVDAVTNWFVDVLLAFPGILLALLVVSILGAELRNVMLAVGASMIPRFARLVRGTTLQAKENLYVEASRVSGAKESRTMMRHVLPNIISPVIVLSTLSLGTAIIVASGLSFLGLGAKPPTPEWGAMLSDGRQFLRSNWWVATFPGVAILITVIAVNLLGDGLRDALDPKMQR